MASNSAWFSSTRTIVIFLSSILFVYALCILPYQLTQMSKQNSTNLPVNLFFDQNSDIDIVSVSNLEKGEWQGVDSVNSDHGAASYWLTSALPTNNSKNSRLLLLNNNLLDQVDIWFITPPAQGSEIVSTYNANDAYYKSLIKPEQFLFEVPSVHRDLHVYIRIESKGPINTPIEIWSLTDFVEYSSLHKLFLGLFFGCMLAMALSNLYVYYATRNNLLLVYTGYVSAIAITIASLHGFGIQSIWPDNMWIQVRSEPIFSCISLIFILTLFINLLDLKANSTANYKTIRTIRYIFVGLLATSFILPNQIDINAVLVLILLASPIIFISSLTLSLQGNLVARYFCAACGVFLLTGITISLEYFGFNNTFIDPSYLLIVATIVEAFLLLLAISIRINQESIHTAKTRDIALKNEREAIKAKDDLIKEQEKNREELEYSIGERTLELEITLRELSEKNVELERLSAIDPLTGLMNRRYFDKRLIAECRRSKREMSNLSLAMLDIDHFKKINDTYGHLCGDHCLKEFATILKETIKRPSDIICRYGGEEFVIILPNTSLEGLAKLLEKVRKNVASKKINFEGQALTMTVSIGACSRAVLYDEQPHSIIAIADEQLYKAKESGRNCVMIKNYQIKDEI